MSLGLDAAAAMLGESRRDLALQRQAVLAANPELRERELAKLADYAAAIAATLRRRGVSETAGDLGRRGRNDGAARGHAAVGQGEDGRELESIMRDAVAELRAVAAGG